MQKEGKCDIQSEGEDHELRLIMQPSFFLLIGHIDMLTYKAHLVGIRVEITEESYTSKASLLDLDPLPVRFP